MNSANRTTEVNISASNGFNDLFNPVNNRLYNGNPIILITLTVVILIYYFLFRSLGSSQPMMEQPMPETPGTSFLEILMWGIFIFLILINGLQYFFSVDAKAAIKNLFTDKPEVELSVMSNEEIKSKPVIINEEVFHIPKNIYSYDEAKALCKAYDSRLAKVDEIEEAYKKGAEWCTYGWSDDQLALYPTQKKTWDKYQNIEGHEHDCGRPGINGGFIKNKDIRFGVNCFGKKPNIRPEEESKLGESPFPLSSEEKEVDAKIEFYRKHIPDIMIAPFNHDKWTEI
tara:strand:+ start:1884 stop:2738 length:855 start_codon:yes stop_codon:yes gene_type:complete